MPAGTWALPIAHAVIVVRISSAAVDVARTDASFISIQAGLARVEWRTNSALPSVSKVKVKVKVKYHRNLITFMVYTTIYSWQVTLITDPWTVVF